MGFELDFEENTRWSMIEDLSYAIRVFDRYAPMHCIMVIPVAVSCVNVFGILQHVVRSSVLPGYYVLVSENRAIFKDLRGQGMCIVRSSGDMSGDCGWLSRDDIASALYRLADGYFTLMVYVLDSEHAERMSRFDIEMIADALDRLAEIGAKLDPDLLERIRELEKDLGPRIHRVGNPEAVERLTDYMPLVDECKLSLGWATVWFGWVRDTIPRYYAVIEYNRLGTELYITLNLIKTGQGYSIIVEPDIRAQSIVANIDSLIDLMNRWKEVALNTLNRIVEVLKMGMRIGTVTEVRCIEVAEAWIEVLKNTEEAPITQSPP